VLQYVKIEGNRLKVIANENLDIFGMAVSPTNNVILVLVMSRGYENKGLPFLSRSIMISLTPSLSIIITTRLPVTGNAGPLFQPQDNSM
jgi:hypothetical protein